jgi:hypothetical protein
MRNVSEINLGKEQFILVSSDMYCVDKIMELDRFRYLRYV